jgi:hypothetical protein
VAGWRGIKTNAATEIYAETDTTKSYDKPNNILGTQVLCCSEAPPPRV